jgi:hypothetical protein
MIELVLLILISFTNGTETDENDDWLPEIEDDPNCVRDYYGPGYLDDLLDRGYLECTSDMCPPNQYGENSSIRDLLRRDPRCS